MESDEDDQNRTAVATQKPISELALSLESEGSGHEKGSGGIKAIDDGRDEP
jgi:hypothetical protein